MVQLSRPRHRPPVEQQLRGHRRVQLVRQRLPVLERAERCARADPAAPQLRATALRASTHASRSAGARALGQHARDRRVQLRPLLRQGTRAALEQHGERQLGGLAPNYAHRRAARLQRDAHLQRATRPVPAGCACCSARSPTSARARSGLRQPGRAIAATPSGGFYVLNGNGAVTAYNGAPALGRPSFDSDLAPRHRGDARRQRLRRAHRDRRACTSSAPPTDPATARAARLPVHAGERPVAVDRDHARRQGLRRAPLRRQRLQVGHRSDGPARRARRTRCSAPTTPGASRSCPTAPATSCSTGSAACGSTAPPRWARSAPGARRSSAPTSARDIVIFSGFGQAFGYYVLDGWGGVLGQPVRSRRGANPRGVAVRRPLARRHDHRRPARRRAQRRHRRHRRRLTVSSLDSLHELFS